VVAVGYAEYFLEMRRPRRVSRARCDRAVHDESKVNEIKGDDSNEQRPKGKKASKGERGHAIEQGFDNAALGFSNWLGAPSPVTSYHELNRPSETWSQRNKQRMNTGLPRHRVEAALRRDEGTRQSNRGVNPFLQRNIKPAVFGV
jgi:hypothetical protein